MKKSHKLLAAFLIIILIPATWFLFFQNSGMDQEEATEILVGQWERSDGPYTIDIKALLDDGKLDASYLNPSPINVGRSTWDIEKDALKVFVRLHDKNYPGSEYKLTYIKDKQLLSGTYFQALSKEMFNVSFSKK